MSEVDTGTGVTGPPAAIVPVMPPKNVSPNTPDPEQEPYEPLNVEAREAAYDAGLTPLTTNEIAEWFGVTPATVRRQWVHLRDSVRDPKLRFPLPTWPGPRWATRVVQEWGVRTGRISPD